MKDLENKQLNGTWESDRGNSSSECGKIKHSNEDAERDSI